MSFALVAVAAAATVGFAGSTPMRAAATSPSAKSAVVACLTDDLSGTVIGPARKPRGGDRTATMRLTNISEHPCRVQGWPDVALVNSPGELVKIGIQRVNEPAAAVAVDVKPGASAWAGLKWHACDPNSKGCGAGVALQFKMDPASDGSATDFEDFPEADEAGLTMTSLQVGTLQPSSPVTTGGTVRS